MVTIDLEKLHSSFASLEELVVRVAKNHPDFSDQFCSVDGENYIIAFIPYRDMKYTKAITDLMNEDIAREKARG